VSATAGREREGGFVTAETAMVLPVLVLLAYLGVVAVTLAQDRVRCADAAREAARAVARGDPSAASVAARAAAGRPVGIEIEARGKDTVVTVRLRTGAVAGFGAFTIVETATAATEGVP
jgi:hypothetical protein